MVFGVLLVGFVLVTWIKAPMAFKKEKDIGKLKNGYLILEGDQWPVKQEEVIYHNNVFLFIYI